MHSETTFRLRSFARVSAVAVLACVAVMPVAAQTATANDQQTQAEVQKMLKGKRFSGVHVTVAAGVVTLTGDVDLLVDKVDAEKKILHDHYVASVHNQIDVDTPQVPDEVLQSKLAEKLVYDRVGYGTTTFNWLTLEVHDGVATVGGVVVMPEDKESALDLLENASGIRGIVDKLQVAPLSGLDWRIRHDEFRAVYGAPPLNRYAIEAAKPIRILVLNGHVTLAGAVDNQGDKNIAGIMANGVPGVFSVVNDLQVTGGGQ